MKNWRDTKNAVMYSILGIMLVVGMLWLHTLVIRSLFIAPLTGLMIIFLFVLWEKPVWVEKIFLILGKHSTNIWLIHMFFAFIYLKK